MSKKELFEGLFGLFAFTVAPILMEIIVALLFD